MKESQHSVELRSASARGRGRLAPTFALCAICAMGGLGFACQGKSTGPGQDSGADPTVDTPPSETSARDEIDLFFFGRQLGAIAPCGCTTEPLGGMQYAFGHIEGTSQAGQRMIIAPGSFLFPRLDDPEVPTDDAGWAQAERRARVLHQRFSALGDDLVVGLGPSDVASPAGDAPLSTYPLPRVLSNAAPDAELPAGTQRSRTVALAGGRKATVWMVLDPSLVPERAPGLPALTDPVAALTKRELSADAGHLNIVVAQGPRALADRIAKEVDGVDLVLMGGALEGADHARLGTPAAKVDADTWVVEPGDRGQTITHLTLRFEAKSDGVPSVVDWQNVAPKEQLASELARVQERLSKFEADPNADPAFLKNLRTQRDELQGRIEGSGPESGTVAVFDQVKVTCKLPPDDAAHAALKGYDGWVSKENQRRFAGVKTPEPAKGEPSYVGRDACGDCHDEALAFWKTTRHAGAYQTLVDVDKQFDLSCVGCHVTGFRKPGGPEVVETRGLIDVQCEQCHGPGSAHVDDPDTDNISRATPVTTCLGCHTQEHSDTFEYDAYLRDVLGDGHGAEARAKLGDGPTGRELRAAGFAKAGGSCSKM